MWETICDAWACWSGWNLVQILTEYPLFWSSEYPPQMKIVRESKSKSFRIPPSPKWKLSESPNPRVSEYPPDENCQRVQIQEFQNTTPPQWKLSESPYLRVSEYPPPPKLKTLVFFPKFKFHVPQNTPPNWKTLVFFPNSKFHVPQNTPPPKKKSDKLQISNFRIV